MSTTVNLPYPVSANRYWRSYAVKGRAMVVVSEEARSYRTQCGWIAKAAGLRIPLQGEIELTITLVPANRVCMDLDNALKVVIDAMKGVAYEDDSQVRKITAERKPPDGQGARVELTVRARTPDELHLFEHVG
jgi:crossover junction endodeoxyribonuclease RusA